MTERFEAAVSREEATAKNQEDLAGVMFETFLDDYGSMKDIAHSTEIISAPRQTLSAMDRCCERIKAAQRDMPTSIEAHLCEDDRNLLDSNFIRLKNLIKLNLPTVIGIGVLVGICLWKVLWCLNPQPTKGMNSSTVSRNLTAGIKKTPRQSP